MEEISVKTSLARQSHYDNKDIINNINMELYLPGTAAVSYYSYSLLMYPNTPIHLVLLLYPTTLLTWCCIENALTVLIWVKAEEIMAPCPPSFPPLSYLKK